MENETLPTTSLFNVTADGTSVLATTAVPNGLMTFSEQDIYNFLIIGSNFFGIIAMFFAIRLKLPVESFVIARLMVVSALFHACVIYPDACLTLSERTWWSADFSYSFAIIAFVFVYIVSMELSELRWGIYMMAETFAIFGAMENPNNSNIIPWVFLGVGMFFLLAKIIWCIYKKELYLIRWRFLILAIIFFAGGFVGDQYGRIYNVFYISHSIWHICCFLGLLLVLIARHLIEKAKSKLHHGVAVPTLKHREEVLLEASYFKDNCITTCSTKCGDRCGDILMACLVGDMTAMEEDSIIGEADTAAPETKEKSKKKHKRDNKTEEIELV